MMTRKGVLIFLVLLAIAGVLSSARHVPSPMIWPNRPGVTVMTLNIRTSRLSIIDWPNLWILRRMLVESVIRTEAPDILALQEATDSQLRWFSEEIPGYRLLSNGAGDRSREYPVILVRAERFPVIEAQRQWFSAAPNIPNSMSWGNAKPRCYMAASLRDEKAQKAFAVASVHLDYQSNQSRQESIRELTDWARDQSYPVILMGDFNERADSANLNQIRINKGEGWPSGTGVLLDSYREAGRKEEGTLNGFTKIARKRIDLVLVSPDWKVEDCRVVKYRRGSLYVSDHYPVVTRLLWPEEPPQVALKGD